MEGTLKDENIELGKKIQRDSQTQKGCLCNEKAFVGKEATNFQ